MNDNYYPNPRFNGNYSVMNDMRNDTYPQAIQGSTMAPNPRPTTPISNNMYTNGFADAKLRYDIVKNNIGKSFTVYASFPDSNERRDVELKGIVEDVGKDYLLMSTPSDGKWYLIPAIYINYMVSDEIINK